MMRRAKHTTSTGIFRPQIGGEVLVIKRVQLDTGKFIRPLFFDSKRILAAILPFTALAVLLQPVPSFGQGKVAIARSAPASVAEELTAPEQAVMVNSHLAWRDGSIWDGNKPPAVFGMDMDRAEPRFTVVDPQKRCLWVDRLLLPIDLKKYPIVSLKYRSNDPGGDPPYLLRLTLENGENKARIDCWKSSDLIGDGKLHELKRDLREQLSDAITLTTIGLCVSTADKPSSLDLVSLSFSAAADGEKIEKYAEESPMKIHVVDLENQPVASAIVVVDAERLNFARKGKTDDDGYVTITPLANETQKHMVRVEKAEFMTVEAMAAPADSGAETRIRTAPASRYGGTARIGSGPAAHAQVMATLDPTLTRALSYKATPHVVTDEKGQWSISGLPAGEGSVTFKLTEATADGPGVTELDASTLKLPPLPPGADVASAQASPTAETTQAAPATKPANGSSQSAATAKPTTRKSVALSTKPSTQPTVAEGSTSQSTPAASEEKTTAPKPSIEPITAILQKVDDTTTGVGWTGVEGDQLLLVLHPQPGKNEPAKMPLADMVDLVLKKPSAASSATTSPSTRPADNLPNSRLMLADDDRLLGTVAGWTDKRLAVHPNISPAATIQIPIASVRQLWCGTADQIKKAQALKEPAGLEDIAFATKEEDVVAVRGLVVGIQDDSLVFRYDNADRKIGLNRLVGLTMAKSDEASADDSLYHAVQFINDDQLSGKLIGIQGKELAMQTRSGESIHLPIDQIAKISTRNGRLVYLSDQKPAKVEQTPYFDRLLEYRVDKSLSGKAITLSDGTYPRGVSMHSRCVLTYNLDGKFSDFRSKVGFTLPEGKVGQAILRVSGDGKTLYENLDARGDQPPVELKLKVAGVRELALEVDYGKNDDVGDRVAWANARLLRAEK